MAGAQGGGKIAVAISCLFSSLAELGDGNCGLAQLFSFAGCDAGQDVGSDGSQESMVSQANAAIRDVHFDLQVRTWYGIVKL